MKDKKENFLKGIFDKILKKENDNMNEEKQYEDFKRLVENTDFWNTFVHIKGSETSGKKE